MLFDFAGVFTQSPFHAVRAWGARCGVDPEIAMEVAFGVYDDDTQHPWQRAERGELALEDAVALVSVECAPLGLTVDPAGLMAFFRASAVQEDILSWARRLHGAGYRAGILTNSIAELGPSWRSLVPLDELFDVVVESCDVGMRKPDPQVYALALERLGVSAARTIFIDDWPGHVAAAKRLGMTGIVMGDDRSAALDELDALIHLG